MTQAIQTRAHSPVEIIRPVAPIASYTLPLKNSPRAAPSGSPSLLHQNARRIARAAVEREAKRKGYDLDRILANNDHDVTIMDLEHATKVWRDLQRAAGKTEGEIDRYWGEILHQTGHNTATWSTVAADGILLKRIVADLIKGRKNMAGNPAWSSVKIVFTSYMNKKYVVLKGYQGHRSLFPLNHYPHAQVAKFGLGKMGGQHLVKAGGILTATLLCGFHVLDYFIRDTATLSQLIGNLGVDLAMVAIGAGLTFGLVNVAVAMGMTFAIGPIAIVVIVGAGSILLLDWFAKTFRIKERVIEGLDWLGENLFSPAKNTRKLPLFYPDMFSVRGISDKITMEF